MHTRAAKEPAEKSRRPPDGPAEAPADGAPIVTAYSATIGVQRAPAPGEAAPADGPAASAQKPGSGGRIIADEDTPTGPEQMRKSEFLGALHGGVVKACEEVLAGTPWEVEGCPYIAYWFGVYAGRSAAEIERAAHAYAPASAGAPDARSMISVLVSRAREAVVQWAQPGGKSESATAGADGESGAPPGDSAPSAGEAPAPPAQLKRSGAETARTVRDVQRRLGSGQSLDLGARHRMQTAFGRSFDDVRVHIGERAGALSTELGARAFTVGKDVAFARGEYRPGTLHGDALIAHELAHVAQQQSAPRLAGKQAVVEEPALENDADRAAILAMQRMGYAGAAGELREPMALRQASGLQLARCKSSPPTVKEVFTRPLGTNLKSAPGEQILLSALFEGKPSEFELVYTATKGHFESASGPATVTRPGLAERGLLLFLDSPWAEGASPTASLEVRHVASKAVVFTRGWTFARKGKFAKTIAQFGSGTNGFAEKQVPWNGSADFEYVLGPDAPPAYEGHTVIERFGGKTCNLTPGDMTPAFRAAHPDLTSSAALASYFDSVVAFRGTFVVDKANMIADTNGMNLDISKLNELATSLAVAKDVTLDKVQTFETEPGVPLGRFTIRKILRSGRVYIIQKFRS